MLELSKILNELPDDDAGINIGVLSTYKKLLHSNSKVHVNTNFGIFTSAETYEYVLSNIQLFLECKPCNIIVDTLRGYCAVCSKESFNGLAIFIYCVAYQISMRQYSSVSTKINICVLDFMKDVGNRSFIDLCIELASIMSDASDLRSVWAIPYNELAAEVSNSVRNILIDLKYR